MLFVVIDTSTCSPNTCYQIEYKNKNYKISEIHVTSGVVSYKICPIYKMLKNVKHIKISRGMNTFSYGAFVSPHGGLGGPPSCD
jgi:hypothetical protein